MDRGGGGRVGQDVYEVGVHHLVVKQLKEGHSFRPIWNYNNSNYMMQHVAFFKPFHMEDETFVPTGWGSLLHVAMSRYKPNKDPHNITAHHQ